MYEWEPIYFCENGESTGDPVKLEDVPIIDLTESENPEEVYYQRLMDDMANISISFTRIGKQFEKLFDSAFRLRKTVIHLCPDCRVKHLAGFSRKYRVRKKNYKRAVRILEELLA